MLSKQYSHRLPVDYDMDIIRRRAIARGKLWDDTKGLAFKAFVMREAGKHGAAGNLYASVYLWNDHAEAADFISGDRFQNVIRSFGRPSIELWLPLDARTGPAQRAKTLYRENIPFKDTADIAALRVAEIEHNRQLARQPDTVAVVTSIDLSAWHLVRLRLSSQDIDAGQPGDAYEVLHLARPELSRLDALSG